MRAAAVLISLLAVMIQVLSPAAAGPALLLDAQTGKVIYAEDQDDLWHPASLTKIMTAYIAFETVKSGKLTLDSKLSYSEIAANQAPSKIGLPVGYEVTVDFALQALIIKSANDIAMVLAEGIEGSEAAFVARMNATARKLGMTRTIFANPNGLPAPQQVTTARDLAILSRAVIRNFPEHAHYWAMTEMRAGKIQVATHNGVLKTFEGGDGLKTGFICDSGYNVVATATRDGRRLIAVVLGEQTGRDRTLRANSLLEHGFQNFGWKTLFNAASLESMPVAADAKPIRSMRESVLAWDCNGRRKPKPAAASAKAKQLKAKAAPQQAAAVPGSVPAGAAPAPPVAKPKPKTAAATPKAVPAPKE